DAARVHRDALARDGVVLEDEHARTQLPGQEEGSGQTVDARAHHHHVPRPGREPSLPTLDDYARRHERYCIGEYAVGRRICAVSRATSGPFFSVSANLARRSLSARKPPHFFSRSARLS